MHTAWVLGDGRTVNFWHDKWMDQSVVSMMNIPDNLHHKLNAKVSDFIVNNEWMIPAFLSLHYPTVVAEITKVPIPISGEADQVVWSETDSTIQRFFHSKRPAASLGRMANLFLWQGCLFC